MPPTLEVFVLWHPDDEIGVTVADTLLTHFHGPAFSGLVGGAVEVYTRSAPWASPDGPPRPLPFMSDAADGPPASVTTVVVIVHGVNLAQAAEYDDHWAEYLSQVAETGEQNPHVAVFGVVASDAVMRQGTRLNTLFGANQALSPRGLIDPRVLCRDLCHSITGFVSGAPRERLRVFISYTTRFNADDESGHLRDLVSAVRDGIAGTHMTTFFDEADIQPDSRWEDEVTRLAETSALFVVRTDRYSSREWCQREVLAAKRSDMPVVILAALFEGEERGSFLMDHLPSVACDPTDEHARMAAIEVALSKLVDDALKRALWRLQREQPEMDAFDWLPANAPEPVTLARWLRTRDPAEMPTSDDQIYVLHPDPPLGPAEVMALDDVLALGGLDGLVEIFTPRTFASRGGRVRR
ncbi:toll/interleukin-1 receptor domain-containing protein [Gordonia aquimaris]|uniref:Toll/interleukin-1 receptor domain-containing protein n=1 Tax=Gordonia aquimaris TaxID=2984863 RepID=A0A9X3I6F9_9ACTN|nr:toll/interleukin-1 receptor domain-containing protein [Gordonia aquimaris]MCX2966838.1 toll/interleukin-1 receptor domain-containing protein [Gordonia aquimaris]